MILYSVENGMEIDEYQLKELSFQASVDLIENIKNFYNKPLWKKLCDEKKIKIEKDKSRKNINKKLRQLAFDLNLNINNSPEEICQEIKKISEIDREVYLKAVISRQEERIERQISGASSLTLEQKRCNVKSKVLNNPYEFSDARVLFLVDPSDKQLYCFTSDMFDSLISSKRNPYTNNPLPVLFLETVKAQRNLLEQLDLFQENNSIKEALEEAFDKDQEINNKLSTEEYNTMINQIRLILNKTEREAREDIVKNFGTNNPLKIILELSFKLFSNCENEIDQSFIDRTVSQGGDVLQKVKNSFFYKSFIECFVISKLNVNKNSELYFRNLSFSLNDALQKIDLAKTKDLKKFYQYTNQSEQMYLKNFLDNIIV